MNRGGAPHDHRGRRLSSASFRRGGHVFRYLALDETLPDLPNLTAAERDVVRLLGEDCDHRSIARERGASVNTVGNQIASIFAKLGVSSRFELVELISRLDANAPPTGHP